MWLDWAINDPAPAGHCGYSALNIACETDLKRGDIVHSVEGYFTYVNPSAVMDDRGLSWGITIFRDGRVWRHRPRPTFVNWHGGGVAQNLLLRGIEMEGKAGEPWTWAQRVSLLRVLTETWAWHGWETVARGAVTNRTQTGIRASISALPPGSLWEHREVSNTSCPSGRDDWGWLVPALREKVSDMEPEEVKEIIASETATLRAEVEALDAREEKHYGWLTSAIGQFRSLFAALGLGQKHGWTAGADKE